MSSINLYIDVQNRRLVSAFNSRNTFNLPAFYIGDSGLELRIHSLGENVNGSIDRPYQYISPTGKTFKVGLGLIDQKPTAGTFNLTDEATLATSGSLVMGARYLIRDYIAGDNFTNVGGTNADGSVFTASGTTPTTWTNSSSLVQVADLLSFDITATDLQAAIRAKLISNYSSATVTGSASGPWTIDRVTLGVITELGGDGAALSPDAFVGIISLRDGTASLSARQRVRLLQAPAAFLQPSTAFPSAATAIAEIQDGSATANEIQRVTINSDTYDGAFTLTASFLGAGNNETKSTGPIPYNSEATAVQDIINAAFGTGNEVSVTGVTGTSWDIAFTGDNVKLTSLALMTGDPSGLDVPVGVSGNLDLNTGNALILLGDAGSVAVTFEVEQTQSGNVTTLIQVSATLVNDLIDPESTGATVLPTYVTAEELAAIIAILHDKQSLTASTTGTTTPTIAQYCKYLTYLVTATSGSGAYLGKVVLSATNRVKGDKVQFILNMADSTNPTIEIDDDTNTAIWTEIGNGNAYAKILFFTFDGTHFTSDQGS